jgi:hypothetical protein
MAFEHQHQGMGTQVRGQRKPNDRHDRIHGSPPQADNGFFLCTTEFVAKSPCDKFFNINKFPKKKKKYLRKLL